MTVEQRAALAEARRPSWGKVNRARYQAILESGGKTILDVGCSTGSYVQQLRQSGFIAFGVDLLLDPAWSVSSDQAFACASALTLPFPSHSFDTILAFEVIEHIPNPAFVLKEFRRVCMKSLVLSVPNCEPQPDILSAGLTYSHWTDRTHCNFFTRSLLNQTLEENGFRVTKMRLINRAFLDYPALRSFYVPKKIAYPLARLLARVPLRKQHYITILAIADRIAP